MHGVEFKGEITIPASKSEAQRAIALALLNAGETTISGLGFCNDEKAALEIVKSAGAAVSTQGGTAKILSSGYSPNESLSVKVGESGLSTRMFTPILANSQFKVVVNGHGSLLSRPMHFFFTVLPELNVSIDGANHTLPLIVQGPLTPKDIEVDGAESSQYITGVVYSYLGTEKAAGKKIYVKNLKSRPYFELSLDVLQKFGISLPFEKDTVIFPEKYKLKGNHSLNINGDWSSASFFIVAAAVNGDLCLHNLSASSKQADRVIITAVKDFGASVQMDKDQVQVTSYSHNCFTFDATDCPDLFPPLAVLALFANGTSEIKGLHRLKHKESDRGEGIKSTFLTLGVTVELDYPNDKMYIKGQQKIFSKKVDSLNDHRMAMALTLVGLLSGKEVVVTNAEAIDKSFPSFYEQLLLLSPTSIKQY